MKQIAEAPRSLMNAACKGADPLLFDEVVGDLVFDALSYCDRCLVQTPCLEYVRPKASLFTGVCGNKVWNNGVQEEPALFDGEGNV
jgi:hypothetical protein